MNTPTLSESSPAPHITPTENWIDVVRERVERLQFGSVQITVHQGRVTQVESLERTRIAPSPNGSG